MDRLAARPPSYVGPTYYDRPVVKRPTYRWLIAGYFFVGGLAGAAGLLATVADLARADRRLVRAGRYVAAAGALASPALLVADLHTRWRWYNMLRIFRLTSPMSIGSWTLAAFGATSTAAAAAERVGAVRVARAAGIPAAALGAVMSVYTAVLASATSVPLWAAAPRVLPPLFGASATSTALAALTLATSTRNGAPARSALGRLGMAVSALELALAFALRRTLRQRGVGDALLHGPLARVHEVGAIGIGTLVPLGVHAATVLTGRPARRASLAAALATLVGGFVLRVTLVFGGRRSAERPREYFQLTQDAR
jgi:formate-dependent nitrite reductase membrane component NrfD